MGHVDKSSKKIYAIEAIVNRHVISSIGCIAVVMTGAGLGRAATTPTEEDATPQATTPSVTLSPVDRGDAFVVHVNQAAEFDDKAKTFIRDQWAQRRKADDAADFLVEGLAVLFPKFNAALEQFEDGEFEPAAAGLTELAKAEDPYLAANSEAFAIKSLVEQGNIEAALARLNEILKRSDELEDYTASMPELHFLLGYGRLQTLEYGQAMAALAKFLRRYPNASERLRSTAMDMLHDLSQRKPKEIGDVADLMGYAGRHLLLGESGQPVQLRQAEAIAMLDTLIQQAEQREKQANQNSASQKQKSPQDPQAGNPADQSKAKGSPKNAVLLRPTVVASPSETWGQMRPEERKKVLQMLSVQFPTRYRQLVEQYYQSLAKER